MVLYVKNYLELLFVFVELFSIQRVSESLPYDHAPVRNFNVTIPRRRRQVGDFDGFFGCDTSVTSFYLDAFHTVSFPLQTEEVDVENNVCVSGDVCSITSRAVCWK